MRVAQINAVYGILSTGVTTRQLSSYLSEKGIPNIAIYGLHKQNDYKRYYVGSFIERKLDILCTRFFKLSGYFSLFSTLRAIRILKKFKPDVIHLRILHEYYINLPMLLKFIEKKNIAVVITLHDCFMFTGVCPYYTINNCYKWRQYCTSCEFSNLNVQKMFADKMVLLSRIHRLGVVGVSDWVTEEAKASKILGGAQIVKRIYNWIDLDLFKYVGDRSTMELREKLKIDKSRFVVLSVSATWSARKRLRDVFSVAETLGSDYCFVVIGNISEKMSIPSNVIQIPTLYNIEELPKYYSLADVFLHPSLEETFGKVTAEALSCGLPAIVYNSTANPELVKQGCGYIIDNVGDVLSIKNAIELVRKNGKAFYSKQCRLFAEENFNMEKNMDEYIDIYRQLLTQNAYD